VKRREEGLSYAGVVRNGNGATFGADSSARGSRGGGGIRSHGRTGSTVPRQPLGPSNLRYESRLGQEPATGDNVGGNKAMPSASRRAGATNRTGVPFSTTRSGGRTPNTSTNWQSPTMGVSFPVAGGVPGVAVRPYQVVDNGTTSSGSVIHSGGARGHRKHDGV
jgi:hypothetical protein